MEIWENDIKVKFHQGMMTISYPTGIKQDLSLSGLDVLIADAKALQDEVAEEIDRLNYYKTECNKTAGAGQ